MTAQVIAADQYDKFKILWADRKMTLARLATVFECGTDAITDTAKRLDLPPRCRPRKGPVDCCRKCRYSTPDFDALEWCKAHPYAEQLPCEIESTPHTDHWREVSVYHSPNGFWQAGDNRRSYR